jgi:hypothetical protein
MSRLPSNQRIKQSVKKHQKHTRGSKKRQKDNQKEGFIKILEAQWKRFNKLPIYLQAFGVFIVVLFIASILFAQKPGELHIKSTPPNWATETVAPVNKNVKY